MVTLKIDPYAKYAAPLSGKLTSIKSLSMENQ